jgi:peptide/nickel transport system substrate-binding protein
MLRGIALTAAALAVNQVIAACAPAATSAPTTAPAPTSAPAATTAPAAATPPTAAAAPTTTPAPTTAPAAGTPKTGGNVIWAINADPNCLGVFGVLLATGHEAKEVMYDSLVAWDKKLQIVPALATEWSAPDDKTYIFKLRQGVKFHNGQEMTADDVKYSIDMQAKSGELPKPAAPIPQFPQIASTEVVDKYTVKLNMKQADPTVLGWFAWSRWSCIVGKGFYDSGNPCTSENGTGPFKLIEYVPNDRVAMTRHADYYVKGQPYIDNLTLKVLPDESARVAALRSGAIDAADISADTAKTLANDPNITVLKGLTSSPRVLQFNIKGDGKPWNKKAVRQAMSKAIDRANLIDKVYGGGAEWATAYPPGGNPDWQIPDADLKNKYYKYDPDGAKKLLADAGYANGFEITISTLNPPPEYQNMAQVVKDNLKAVGITVNLQIEDSATFAARYNAGTFEWLLNGRGMRNDILGYINEFGDPTIGQAKLWFNGGEGWKNDEIIALYKKIGTTVDQKARIPDIIKLQQLVIDEAPHVFLCQPYTYTAVRKRVQDMYVSFTGFRPGLRTIWVNA